MTPMYARTGRLVAGALLVIAVAACGSSAAPTPTPSLEFGIRTAAQTFDACMDALIGGTLARHPQSGLGIANEGEQTPVEWPFRYSARVIDGRVILFDETGKAVAAEGDEITVGGGFGNQFWHACAPVNRVAN